MQQRRIAWSVIAGILLPIALHTCMGWSPGTLLFVCSSTAIGARVTGKPHVLVGALTATVVTLRLWFWAEPSLPKGALDVFNGARRDVAAHIGTLLPEPQASFLAGLLTGERGSLPQEVAQDMRLTGLTHILAVSGSNIALVLLALEHLFFFLPRTWRTAPLALGVILFTLFCGAEASVVRACIMGILQVTALHVGRPADTRLLVGWTAAFMLLIAPSQLTDDAGFQLSFLAVIGLCEFQRPIERLCNRAPQAFGIREALITTLAAQTTAGAWSAYVFGTLPLHAPLLNLLVAPLIPLAMLSGTAGTVVGIVSPTLGSVLMVPGWAALSGILAIGHAGATMTPLIIGSLQGRTALLAIWFALLAVFWNRTVRSGSDSAILGTDATARHPGATAAGGTLRCGPSTHP